MFRIACLCQVADQVLEAGDHLLDALKEGQLAFVLAIDEITLDGKTVAKIPPSDDPVSVVRDLERERPVVDVVEPEGAVRVRGCPVAAARHHGGVDGAVRGPAGAAASLCGRCLIPWWRSLGYWFGSRPVACAVSPPPAEASGVRALSPGAVAQLPILDPVEWLSAPDRARIVAARDQSGPKR